MNSELRVLNCLILNRDGGLPADKWYQIAPLGEFWATHQAKNADGELVPQLILQVVDQDALNMLVSNFKAMADRMGPNFGGVRIDRDHLSENSDQTTEAMGWIKNIEARADGLYAQIEWSDEGEKAVNGKRYKFVSPTWYFSIAEKDLAAPSWWSREPKTYNRVKPTELEYLALTNNPNLKGMKPLSNRGGDGFVEQAPESTKGTSMDYKAMLLQILGLPSEATDEQVKAALDSAGTMENCKKEIDALKNRVAEFETKELDAKVQKALDDHKDRINNRDEVTAALRKDFDGTMKILNSIKVVEPAQKIELRAADTKTPEGVAGKAGNRRDQLWAEYNQIKNAADRTKFYRKNKTEME